MKRERTHREEVDRLDRIKPDMLIFSGTTPDASGGRVGDFATNGTSVWVKTGVSTWREVTLV